MSRQLLIALDQTLNTLIWLKGDGFGYADETLSARAYRLREQHPWLMRSIDTIFFWDDNHCEESYYMEILRNHLPNEYRTE